MITKLLFILSMVMISACAAFVPVRSSDVRQYALSLEAASLSSRPLALSEGLETLDLTLVLREASAPSYINSRNIVFSRSPQTRGTYQLSTWVENPPESFTRILLRRLEDGALFRQVAKSPTTAAADLFLATEIVQFFHDVSSSPGEVVVEIRAELTRAHRRQIIGSRSFSRRLPGPTFDAKGAAIAFNRAIGEIVEEVVLWTYEASALTKSQP
jgi:cholesterol transport system auxiliary component